MRPALSLVLICVLVFATTGCATGPHYDARTDSSTLVKPIPSKMISVSRIEISGPAATGDATDKIIAGLERAGIRATGSHAFPAGFPTAPGVLELRGSVRVASVDRIMGWLLSVSFTIGLVGAFLPTPFPMESGLRATLRYEILEGGKVIAEGKTSSEGYHSDYTMWSMTGDQGERRQDIIYGDLFPRLGEELAKGIRQL